MNLDVNEIFYSIQGEGPLVGVPTLFLRLNGCNLRCSWCDSKYTWEETPESYSIDSIQEQLDKMSQRYNQACKHLVITGGEPLLQQDALYDLIGMLYDYHITIETNGTIDPHSDLFDQVSLWMVSPKKDQVLASMLFGDYLDDKVWYKFVVDRRDKIDWIDEFIKDWELKKERIMLMPQATFLWQLHDEMPWIMKLAKERGYRVSPRLHVTAYGNARGV